MVEMKVFGLALDDTTQVPVLVLKDGEGERSLPIWIGAMEAMAISMALNDVELPRPMTHDLLLNILAGLEAPIVSVEIVELSEGTYFAEIVLLNGDEEVRIDSRPSDAIAIALRAEVPIMVAESVLVEAEKTPQPGASPALDTEDAGKWNDLLENFDPDDKYKM